MMPLFSRHTRLFSGLCISGLMLVSAHAVSNNSLPQSSDETVKKLYHILHNNPTYGMAKRLDAISGAFTGKPYILGALGEGPNGRYDESPLYRTDGFDCQTYVDTVLAMSLANTLQAFQICINKIRYHNAEVDYLTRNHFTSLDWNLNNQKQGYLRDITRSIKNKQQQPIARMAAALIDKPSWYQHTPLARIKLGHASPELMASRLAELKARGSKLDKTTTKIPYLPLDVLFDQNGNADKSLFAQIPDASIVEIVRPNWDLQQQIGTHLNVSHLGFVFWKGDTLIFRQASSNENRVIDIPLIEYLDKTRSSPTIRGINVQVIVPNTPLDKNCIARIK